MATLNLAAYKPSAGQAVASSPISNAFTAIEAAVNSIDNTQFAAGRIFDATKLIEASSVQRIADSTAGGSVANFDFTSISANFVSLMIVTYLRGDTALAIDGHNVRFNNDSAANYDSQYVRGNAASASAAESLAGTSAAMGLHAAASASASLFGSAISFVPQYAGTTGKKYSISVTGTRSARTTGTLDLRVMFGSWDSTAAINRVTIIPSAGNFVIGSRVSIYGLG